MYIRKVGEVQHNTAEQVRDYAEDALKIADELALSDADRATLLPTIMQQIASKQVFMEQQQVSPAGILGPDGMR